MATSVTVCSKIPVFGNCSAPELATALRSGSDRTVVVVIGGLVGAPVGFTGVGVGWAVVLGV